MKPQLTLARALGYLLIIQIFFAACLVAAAETTVKWHGHAAFEIKTPTGLVLLVDPWLSNPANPNAKDALSKLGKVDYILITHGHSDHVGDAVAIAKKTKARLIASFELGTNLAKAVGFPEKQMGFDTLGNPGGKLSFADGAFSVTFTPAVHSSGLEVKKGAIIYGGNPVGFVIAIKDGPTIYHSGDTAYFSDMKLIGEKSGIDLALINIGGHFGMEQDAAAAAANAVKAKVVVPHHYKTFPILTPSAEEFSKAVQKQGQTAVVLEPGQSLRFSGRELLK